MTTSKRPRDTNQLAKMVVDIATGDMPAEAPKRAGNRRFTRLTNAFSKKVENHRLCIRIIRFDRFA